MIEAILPFVGVALCVIAALPLALWTAQSISVFQHNREQFRLSQELLRQQILTATTQSGPSQTAAVGVEHSKRVDPESPTPLELKRCDPEPAIASDGSWTGFRSFRVHKLVKETAVCTSVYLHAEDGGSITTFQPGQHLPLRFNLPGQDKPVVRCYSLSDGPGKGMYRISVKAVPGHAGKAPGLVSQFVNTQLAVGDKVESRSPSGSFYMNPNSTKPLVMLAGGIGVTPMISMLEEVRKNHRNRLAVLVYGVQNKADQAFAEYLRNVSKECTNIHVVNCFSSPDPQDVEGTDYQVRGFVSAELLKQLLPTTDCDFYLCGPPPFMESLNRGLLDWPIPESQIFTEAFGPASIGKKAKVENTSAVPAGGTVRFSRSDRSIAWAENCESLLELAEANDIPLDSGCRAGGCGTCAVELLSGSVTYPEGMEVACQPEMCLTCIARPKGDVELGA